MKESEPILNKPKQELEKAFKAPVSLPTYEPLDEEQDKVDQMLEQSGQQPTLLGC